ncbi:zinc knuckle CX2CX4HX4C containing protein [Tanacetum coccineum]
MANNTKCIPKGIVKKLLIKIDIFILPIDFVILDLIEDFRMPVILGRPLLATTHAKVDIFRKTIFLEVGNEKVIDCFEEALDLDKDPMEKRFDDYKWVFKIEIEQLADEYELGIGKKGHILDMIWENCRISKERSKNDGENKLAKDGDFLDFFVSLLYSEAKLKGVSCSNSTLPIYFISLMYNMDIVENKWEGWE